MGDREEKFPEKPLEDQLLDDVAQIELGQKLQSLLLRRYHARLKDGTISDTGMAALQRLLASNGWTLDPAALPEDLRKMLTSEVSFEDDDDIIPIRKAE